MRRKQNGYGSVRELENGSWECIIQSKYINPKTGNPKRIKRKGANEKKAIDSARMALDAWEKEIERGNDLCWKN